MIAIARTQHNRLFPNNTIPEADSYPTDAEDHTPEIDFEVREGQETVADTTCHGIVDMTHSGHYEFCR